MELAAKLQDPRQTVLFYGTTPPREGTPAAQVEAAAARLAERIAALAPDAIVVYDIQDESGRTSAPRPFPFARTLDPRHYAALLEARTGRPAIVYKSLGAMDEPAWRAWLDATAREFPSRLLSVVGRPTSGVRHALSLAQAIGIAADHPARFTVGAVAIAERHSAERSEAARMLAKSLAGARFFVSQTVYAADATVRLLADYARDCRGAGVEPRRVVLTFAPVGREKTLAFLRWLGVHVPEETAREILGAPDPLARSLALCTENLRRIAASAGASGIPLGANAESVSIHRDEIEASAKLLGELGAALGR